MDVEVVAKLLFYLTPNLIPMVLPLTILVASIMTFGNFSENYEFAAMKSSGISLQRAMRSLIFFISILSVTTFFFANDVIPWSRYKSINLRRNIQKLKPSLAIVEGSFNQVGDYNIKVGKKTGKNGEDLEDVIIHKKMDKNRGMIVIKAESGKLKGSKDSDMLALILYDGTLYQKIHATNYKQRRRRPFVKNQFGEYRFNIDLSGFNDVDFDSDDFSNSASMLNISELRTALDSLSERFNGDRQNYLSTLLSRTGTEKLLQKNTVKSEIKEAELYEGVDVDSVQYNPKTKEIKPYKGDTLTKETVEFFETASKFLVESEEKDTLVNLSKDEKWDDAEEIKQITSTSDGTKDESLRAKPVDESDKDETDKDYDIATLDDFFNSYEVREQKQLTNLALSSTEGTLRTIKGKKQNFRKKAERLNITEIEIHDKYALAVMCYVLFFVGAPLGAIIRKGGIGMPMVVAIVLFLVYYYIGMFAKNSAKDGSISPFIATWISTFIMLPLSIMVTYRATTDRGFFNPDSVIDPIRRLFSKVGLVRRKKEN